MLINLAIVVINLAEGVTLFISSSNKLGNFVDNSKSILPNRPKNGPACPNLTTKMTKHEL